MKKVIALLLAAVMVFALCACGQQAAQEVPEAAPAATAIPAATAVPAADESESTPAQLDYPKKSLEVIIPFGAGGATDLGARIVAKYLSKYVGEDINCINVTGGSGAVGMQECMNRDADGYSLCIQASSMPMHNALGTFQISYDDFELVSGLFSNLQCICVRSDSSIQTVEELVEELKANPQFKYGAFTNSIALGVVLAMEDYIGKPVNLVDVAEESKTTELLAGRIDCLSDFVSSVKPYVDSGDFRMLGVFAESRLPDFPDVPTFIECGIDYPLTIPYFGIMAPKGTPAEIVEFLSEKIGECFANEPEMVEELAALNYVADYKNSADYYQTMKDSFQMFAAFVENQIS